MLLWASGRRPTGVRSPVGVTGSAVVGGTVAGGGVGEGGSVGGMAPSESTMISVCPEKKGGGGVSGRERKSSGDEEKLAVFISHRVGVRIYDFVTFRKKRNPG